MLGNYAVVLAGGKGRRMGKGVNKQFINIKGKPMLAYTLEVFSNCPTVEGIVLVCAADELDYCKKQIIEKYNIKKIISFVTGGERRQDSVYNGLKALEEIECDIVIIHDGARPFVDCTIINAGITFAKEYGGSACGVTPKDTIKLKDTKGLSSITLDRAYLVALQTPQCFIYNQIIECHEKLRETNLLVTDDTMVYEKFGYSVYLYEGSYENIKITTVEDLHIAEEIIKRNEKTVSI